MASGEVVDHRDGGHAGHREAVQDAGDGDDAPESGAEPAGHLETKQPPTPTGSRKMSFATGITQ